MLSITALKIAIPRRLAAQRWLVLKIALCLMTAAPLTGCGANDTIPPRIAERADVIITYDGKQRSCIVTLYSEPQGSAVPCDGVVPFIKNELRLPSGSIYDTRTSSDADESEMAHLASGLNAAGYRFIRGDTR